MIEKLKFRTQFDDRLEVKYVDFPPSVVQSGQSPSISKIVQTRRVGGNDLDDYEMNGIAENAPFDSEYYDYFDMQDMAQAEAERKASEQAPQEKGGPPTSESTANADSSENESEKQ